MREIVASYPSYERAQEAVDRLSDAGFPVEALAIEGRGMRIVEQVTGRVTYASAALQGAATGAVAGLFIGLVFGVLNWLAVAQSAIALALWGALIGAAWGAILGLLGHGMTQGRRDFASVDQIAADRYDVTADLDVADEARRLLEGSLTSRRSA